MKSRFIIALIVIMILSACQGRTSQEAEDIPRNVTAEAGTRAAQVETIVAATLTAYTPFLQPTFTPTPGNEWTLHTVDLFGFTLNLPWNWKLEEINRRPESSDSLGPSLGHDCADYQISSPDHTATMFIRPVCGFGEGIPDKIPADTVIINPGATGNLPGGFEENQIGRFLYEGNYVYTHCYILPYEDLNGTHTEDVCVFPPALWIKDLVPLVIQFNYSGNVENRDQVFNIADRIVLSITKK